LVLLMERVKEKVRVPTRVVGIGESILAPELENARIPMSSRDRHKDVEELLDNTLNQTGGENSSRLIAYYHPRYESRHRH